MAPVCSVTYIFPVAEEALPKRYDPVPVGSLIHNWVPEYGFESSGAADSE